MDSDIPCGRKAFISSRMTCPEQDDETVFAATRSSVGHDTRDRLEIWGCASARSVYCNLFMQHDTSIKPSSPSLSPD